MNSESEETSGPLHFSLKLPSLKELTLIKVARILWSTPKIRQKFRPQRIDFIREIRREYDVNHIRSTEVEVLQQIPLLPLPECIKEQLNPIVRYVGRVLFQWLNHFQTPSVFYNSQGWRDKIFQDCMFNDYYRWTGYGTIDLTQMATWVLVENYIPIYQRFVLSCNLCLEGEIRRLWHEMDPEVSAARVATDCFNNHITKYWLCKMINTTFTYCKSKYSSAEEFLLEEALIGNDPTFGFKFKHFWSQLNHAQQEGLKAQIEEQSKFGIDNVLGLLLLVLNTMARQEQNEFLRLAPSTFLLHFVERPWQHLFFPTLNATINHIDEYQFRRFIAMEPFDHFDDRVRHKIFFELGPLVEKYIYRNLQTSSRLIAPKRRPEGILKELMLNAPDSRKFDVIDLIISTDSNDFDSAKGIVIEWVTPDTWPELKTRLMKLNRQRPSCIEGFIQYFNNFFANNGKRYLSEVGVDLHTQKRKL